MHSVMKKKSILAIGVMVVMMSCSGSSKNNSEQTVENSTVTTEEQVKEQDFSGIYEGTLPAADCPGIKTVLIINADKTYNLKSEYLEEKDGLFETSGVYNLLDGQVIELVTPSSGEKIYYKIIENGVMLSDSIGTVNQGELAEHYVLKKK